jgi:predicted GIY-YIG superfamily endonuclease
LKEYTVRDALNYTIDEIDLIPSEKSGVYILCTDDNDYLYIGRATDVSQRVKQHLIYATKQRFSSLVSKIKVIFTNKLEYKGLERKLINQLKPMFNEAETNYDSFYTRLHSEDFNEINLSEWVVEWKELQGSVMKEPIVKETEIKTTIYREGDSVEVLRVNEIIDILTPEQKKIVALKQAKKIVESALNEDSSFVVKELDLFLLDLIDPKVKINLGVK